LAEKQVIDNSAVINDAMAYFKLGIGWFPFENKFAAAFRARSSSETSGDLSDPRHTLQLSRRADMRVQFKNVSNKSDMPISGG
jgi:hypothetical protein